MSLVVSKATILGYLGDAPAEVINQVSNILESHFHKTEGKIVKTITEANDKVTIAFSDDTTKTFYTDVFVDALVASLNASPVNGWIFVKTETELQALTGDSTKGYYVLKDDVDATKNGAWGFDGSVFYKADDFQIKTKIKSWAKNETFDISNQVFDTDHNLISADIVWAAGDVGDIDNVTVGVYGTTSIRYNRSDGKYASRTIIYDVDGFVDTETITLTGF